MMCEHPKNDYKDDQEFNSNPQKHKEATDEKQNKLLEHEVGIQQNEYAETSFERAD